jgi:glycosyltransferase involved in cell wall biosynthesis
VPVLLNLSTPDSIPAAGSPEAAPERRLRVLCVTLWGDRAEAATFIGLERTGCDVSIVCLPDCGFITAFREAGLRVLPIALQKRVDSDAIRRLRAELAAHDYDIVHLLHNRAVSNGLIAVRRFPRLKVIAYRGIVGNVSPLSPVSWLRYLNPRVDRVICVAEAVRKYFVDMRLLGLKLDPKKFVTIYKGHDLAWYRDTPVDLAAFDIPAGAFVVGCVANIRPRKGIEVLVDAFGQLPAEAPSYLLLVGNMKSERLDRAIAANPNRERIRKVGYRKDAPAVIAACDVSVLPTLRREGLPKTVIEAMVYGVPPIVTDAGGSPELVVHGDSGLVVPPGDAQALADAITKLRTDEPLRRRMGQRARQRIATHFNTQTTVAQTLALYRELTGAGND